jgi:hypothetical protein
MTDSEVSIPDKAQWPDLKVEQWPIERLRKVEQQLSAGLGEGQIAESVQG